MTLEVPDRNLLDSAGPARVLARTLLDSAVSRQAPGQDLSNPAGTLEAPGRDLWASAEFFGDASKGLSDSAVSL